MLCWRSTKGPVQRQECSWVFTIQNHKTNIETGDPSLLRKPSVVFFWDSYEYIHDVRLAPQTHTHAHKRLTLQRVRWAFDPPQGCRCWETVYLCVGGINRAPWWAWSGSSVCVVVQSQELFNIFKHTFHVLPVICILSTVHSPDQVSSGKNGKTGYVCVCVCMHAHA